MPEAPFLRDVLIFLLAAVLVTPIFQRLKFSPVLGYLVAGAVIGPFGIGLIGALDETRALAEFGVVFLLFTIGLDLPIERLRVIRGHVFGLGTAQVLLCGGVIGAIAVAVGLDITAAVVIGAGLALSSTAMVLQLLSERGELASRTGRVTLAILLLQDLSVVLFLALVPLLVDTGPGLGQAVAIAALRAVAALVGIVIVGRLVLRPLFRVISIGNSAELFVAVTLLILLGTSWLTHLAGLSMALGAFLAGLLLAETEYRHQVETDIRPFRGIFLGLFFMTVGMSLNFTMIADRAGLVFGVMTGLVLVKSVLIAGLCRLFRLPLGVSLHIGLVLAEGGEFAFVLFAMAMSVGVIGGDAGQILVLAVALSMVLTPFLAMAGRRVSRHAELRQARGAERIADSTADLTDHVVIAGFGRVGQTVAAMLTAERIPYIAFDLDLHRVAQKRANGLPVFFGDASHTDLLRAAGADRARSAVVTLDDPGGAERAVAALRECYPELQIFVRARDVDHGARLAKAGATGVVREAVEASLQLGGSVLHSCGAAVEEVEDVLESFRRDDYAGLDDLIRGIDTAQNGAMARDGARPTD